MMFSRITSKARALAEASRRIVVRRQQSKNAQIGRLRHALNMRDRCDDSTVVDRVLVVLETYEGMCDERE
jgi:hypothetical protein